MREARKRKFGAFVTHMTRPFPGRRRFSGSAWARTSGGLAHEKKQGRCPAFAASFCRSSPVFLAGVASVDRAAGFLPQTWTAPAEAHARIGNGAWNRYWSCFRLSPWLSCSAPSTPFSCRALPSPVVAPSLGMLGGKVESGNRESRPREPTPRSVPAAARRITTSYAGRGNSRWPVSPGAPSANLIPDLDPVGRFGGRAVPES